MDVAERVEVRSRAEWRAWLERRHRQVLGIWLLTFKKHHPSYLPWRDMVQVALCFGWIDGQARKLDDDRTMRYLSPRKRGSPWSGLNKQHVKELLAKELMHASGVAAVEAAKSNGSWSLLDDVEAMIVPPDLKAALTDEVDALRNYEGFSGSAKRGLLWWIKSAGRDKTRNERIAKTVAAARRGKIANQSG